jgi:prolyl-tRNA editing enzyme YbaK/EbsC (Cys-tRNA(Pro) deacylase)
MNLKIGTLEFVPATENTGILAEPVARMLATLPGVEVVGVSEIDPSVSDTAAFCARYQMGPETAANCVIVEGKRGEERTYAACMILATTRLDVNKKVKELLGVKKVSFAQMETAVEKSGMEFGAITPVGLPADWPIFIDCLRHHWKRYSKIKISRSWSIPCDTPKCKGRSRPCLPSRIEGLQRITITLTVVRVMVITLFARSSK